MPKDHLRLSKKKKILVDVSILFVSQCCFVFIGLSRRMASGSALDSFRPSTKSRLDSITDFLFKTDEGRRIFLGATPVHARRWKVTGGWFGYQDSQASAEKMTEDPNRISPPPPPTPTYWEGPKIAVLLDRNLL